MSLIAREYALALDEVLEDRLTAKERKLAWREVRGVIDDLAFSHSLREGRIPPSDDDYHLALEAVKPPAAAAEVFVRRQPVYAGRVRRKRITTWSILLFLALFGTLSWGFITSEASEPLISYSDGGTGLEQDTFRTFNVTRDYTRLEIVANVFSSSFVEVMIIDPRGDPVWSQTFGEDRNWAHGAVASPLDGQYLLRVRFVGEAAANAISVDVRGVYATR